MKVSIVKRGLGILMTLVMMAGMVPAVSAFAAEPPKITFKTLGTNWPGYNPASDGPDATNPETFTNAEFNQAMSYSKDMPVFDGVPEHLDAYIDTYLDWVGLEGVVLYATGLRDSYRMKLDPDSAAYGKLVPGGLAAADNANGISNNSAPTDFPTFSAQGTTWNPDLMYQVGEVIGKEKMVTLQTAMDRNRNRHNGTDWSGLRGTTSSTIAFGVLTDMHVNPLAGRADEGYGEDVYHMGLLANAQAEGFVGYNDGKASSSGSTDDDTFYTRGIIATKHPSIYTTEWFRQTANNSVGARGMYEWQVAGPLKGYATGAIMGGMTSFGRTNGIPNEISSYNILYNQISKYGYYSSPDFNAENHMYAVQGNSSSMSNGYDIRYVQDRAHALALMSLGNTESVRAMGTDQTDVAALYNLVKSGAYGITEEDLRNSARGLLANMVRAGFFDEVDAQGFPVHYPYVDESRDGTDATWKENNANGTVQAHIDTAMAAAQEAIVVLKSDGRLPAAGDEIAVAGHYADTRYTPQTAYSSTVSYTRIDHSGTTPLFELADLYKKAGVTTPSEKINFSQGAQVVTIADNQGRLLTAPEAEAGGALTFEAALTGTAAARQQFELFDMGQDAVLLRSVHNSRWVTNATAPANTTAQAANNFVLTTDLDAGVMSNTNKVTSIPPRLGRIRHSDTSFSLYSGYSDTYVSTNLRMLQSTAEGAFSAVSSTFQAEMDTTAPERRFTFNQVASPGAEAISVVEDAEAALVFVGAHARNSAGEGRDRTSMAMGSTDYQLVRDIAAAYAAKDKPVIVVVRSSYVLLMQDPNSDYNIQDDDNVSTILYQSFGGRYEGLAMAQSLLGQITPSGRMSTSWYMGDYVLPAYDYAYSVPSGASNAYVNGGEDYIGYRFQKVDLTNADPQETGLTYMYADPADVQYEFGYGVNINPDFYIPDDQLTLAAPSSAAANATFNVNVSATNVGVGNADGIEVFQLYAKKIDSAYGDASPKNKLIAFKKVAIPAGASAEIVLTVDPQDLAIWDVNSGGYVVEEGAYELQLGYSAYDIRKTATINITGGGAAPVATLNPSEFFNVFDHAYKASDVVYQEASKLRTAQSLKLQAIVGGYSAAQSKQDGAYVAIPKVDLTGLTEISAYVATDKTAGNIELWADAPGAGGTKIATLAVPVTEVVYVDADGILNTQNNQQNANVEGGVQAESSELGYALVETTTDASLSGTHDLYVVFKAADLRIDTLQIL
ncbi:glycoside hydrolase family 3 C-terminal domain-containing protein, partial [Ruminococcaceae bacterium OttesenSCG-928-A11]|nr:glycoside hydrolase family 3 C-terminal domain-containing protein [Ruminococcaceae bacterium OttesenSCG-928-A11]